MGNPSTPPPGGNPPPPHNDLTEILRFLSEESRKNREAMRQEASAVNELFIRASKIVAIPLAVVIALAGIFFYRSLGEMKQEMVNEGKIEAKLEIQKMEKHIDETLEAQFATDKIKTTIQQAAQNATREQAPALIKEVITPEVKEAVARQSGTIKDIATNAATDEVNNTIKPIAAGLKIEDLITRTNLDDAKAFDELLQVRGSLEPDQKEKVDSAIAGRYSLARDRFNKFGDISGCLDPRTLEYQQLLASHDSATRYHVMFNCRDWWTQRVTDASYWSGKDLSPIQVAEQVTPEFVQVALNDAALSVRGGAVFVVNDLFKFSPGYPNGGFDLLVTSDLRQWWHANQPNYRILAVISLARRPDYVDIGEIYDGLKALEPSATPRPRGDVEETLRNMRDEAIREQPQTSTSAQNPGWKAWTRTQGTCSVDEREITERLKSWKADPTLIAGADYRQDEIGFEIAYLENCPIVADFVPEVVRYSTGHSMKLRYSATVVLNKWLNTKFDFFDSKAIKDWWANHKEDYATTYRFRRVADTWDVKPAGLPLTHGVWSLRS
jgi:hypothetical protein